MSYIILNKLTKEELGIIKTWDSYSVSRAISYFFKMDSTIPDEYHGPIIAEKFIVAKVETIQPTSISRFQSGTSSEIIVDPSWDNPEIVKKIISVDYVPLDAAKTIAKGYLNELCGEKILQKVPFHKQLNVALGIVNDASVAYIIERYRDECHKIEQQVDSCDDTRKVEELCEMFKMFL